MLTKDLVLSPSANLFRDYRAAACPAVQLQMVAVKFDFSVKGAKLRSLPPDFFKCAAKFTSFKMEPNLG